MGGKKRGSKMPSLVLGADKSVSGESSTLSSTPWLRKFVLSYFIGLAISISFFYFKSSINGVLVGRSGGSRKGRESSSSSSSSAKDTSGGLAGVKDILSEQAAKMLLDRGKATSVMKPKKNTLVRRTPLTISGEGMEGSSPLPGSSDEVRYVKREEHPVRGTGDEFMIPRRKKKLRQEEEGAKKKAAASGGSEVLPSPTTTSPIPTPQVEELKDDHHFIEDRQTPSSPNNQASPAEGTGDMTTATVRDAPYLPSRRLPGQPTTVEEDLEFFEDAFDGYYTIYPPSLFGAESEEVEQKQRDQWQHGGKWLLHNSSCYPQRPLLPDNKTMNPHHCGIMINTLMESRKAPHLAKATRIAIKEVLFHELWRILNFDYMQSIPVVVIGDLLFGEEGRPGAREKTPTAGNNNNGAAANAAEADLDDSKSDNKFNEKVGGFRQPLSEEWLATYKKYRGPMPPPKDTSELPGYDFTPVVEGYGLRVVQRYTLSELPSFVHFYHVEDLQKDITKLATNGGHRSRNGAPPEDEAALNKMLNYSLPRLQTYTGAQPYSLAPLSPFRRTLLLNISVRIGIPGHDGKRQKMTPPTLLGLPILDHYDFLFIPAPHHDVLMRPLAEYEEELIRYMLDGGEAALARGDPLSFFDDIGGIKRGGSDGGMMMNRTSFAKDKEKIEARGRKRLKLLSASTNLDPTFQTAMMWFRSPWDPMGGMREGSNIQLFLSMWKALNIRYLQAEGDVLSPYQGAMAKADPKDKDNGKEFDYFAAVSPANWVDKGPPEITKAPNDGPGDIPPTPAPTHYDDVDVPIAHWPESSYLCAKDASMTTAIRESGLRYQVLAETNCQDHRYGGPDNCGLIRGRWKDRYLTTRCDGYSAKLDGSQFIKDENA